MWKHLDKDGLSITLDPGINVSVPYVLVGHSAAQSITSGVNTALNFDTEITDPNSIHDPATNTRLICRTAGKYLIFGTAGFAGNATGVRYLWFSKNGALSGIRYGFSSQPPNATENNLIGSFVLDLQVNDYMELVVHQNSGGALNTTNSAALLIPAFGMVYLGPGIMSSGGGDKELAYTEFTSTVAPTATTEGTANTIVTAPSLTFDGQTTILVEFFSPASRPDAGAVGRKVDFVLYDNGAFLSRMGAIVTPAAQSDILPVFLKRRIAPSTGVHQYSVRAFVDAGTAQVFAGLGGAGQDAPGYTRIVRV